MYISKEDFELLCKIARNMNDEEKEFSRLDNYKILVDIIDNIDNAKNEVI